MLARLSIRLNITKQLGYLGQQFAANAGSVVLGAIYSTGGKDQLTPMGSFPPHKDVDAVVNNCSANDVTDMANIANADTATESKPNDARANEGKPNDAAANESKPKDAKANESKPKDAKASQREQAQRRHSQGRSDSKSILMLLGHTC